ncbi:type II toxin-antitoxin system VapC family toxin [Rhizobium sp. KVB221]|uniref:Ribonuclease VapC n=1 Tax=Rhizobium setariae TaxID=2801340 RepID=A0A937CMN4_9HYPH|nr:type II toxin-antitoxin system VapC family toxin [Rhizobium setariae]MBL0374525.1 type II toxin-antitoxin system VapC family toxin [Rhizobium setariae]
MKFLLDSNAVIAILKGNSTFHARLTQHRPINFAIPSIVMHELYCGAYKSERRKENLARLAQIQFPVLEFDHEDAIAAGEIRAALTSRGQPIGAYDVLIAGQACCRKLTLISRNVREFSRIEELSLENWED